MSIPTLLEGLARAIELERFPDPVERLESGGKTWDRYEYVRHGTHMDLAISIDYDGETFVILAFSLESDHDKIYNEAFLPAMEAIKQTRP